jgi:hypothetical protein
MGDFETFPFLLCWIDGVGPHYCQLSVIFNAEIRTTQWCETRTTNSHCLPLERQSDLHWLYNSLLVRSRLQIRLMRKVCEVVEF